MDFMNKKFEDVIKELHEARLENRQYKKNIDCLNERVNVL